MKSFATREAAINTLRERTPKSGAMWEKAKDTIPGGLTSGARKMVPYPVYIDRGDGAYLYDIDGNRYIDCICGFGIHLLGHCPEVVVDAVQRQAVRGMSFGTPHEHEVEYTQRLIDTIPCAEQVMLCNSGTEATMLTWRLMRAATGKDKIAKFEGCYHGWHDYAQWSVVPDPNEMGPAHRPNMLPGSAGIPKGAKDTMIVMPFNESAFDIIRENKAELAGVSIEPVIGSMMLTIDQDWFKKLADVTRDCGLLLHSDEVITGFRLALGGCQELYGILPDVATYGKIIAGGTPVGAIACSKNMVEIAKATDDGFSAAGTFSGNPMTLAVGCATLNYLQDNRYIYNDMMAKGEYLRSNFNDYMRAKSYPFVMTGLGSMFQIHAVKDLPQQPVVRDLLVQDDDLLDMLQLQFRLNDILLPWMHLAFFGAAHTQEIIDEMLSGFKSSVENAMALRK